jgi:DNA helicase-2/ATP-dependent DNA helicase PcrA
MTHPIAGAHAPPAGGGHDPLLDELTPEQAQAVCHGPGPLLLIAGPGAGKTKTLIHRIAKLLRTGIAQPWEILAVTFSVRAAGELRLRLADLLGEQVACGVTAATFHSICARMLREHAGVFGRTEHYTVYDQADVRRMIEWLLSDQQRGQVQQALATHGHPAASEVLTEISLAKNRLLTPDSYAQQAPHTAAPLIAAVWREAEIELRRSNSFDFDDLLAYAVRLLAEQPHHLTYYRERWKWLLVDEYQDTNEVQSALVALLAGAGGNVCAVADDDQLIYSWRGAQPRNVLAFAERFPSHERIVLGRNFRCRAEILQTAVACVSHNRQRLPKALIAHRGAGGPVRVAGFGCERQEAEWAGATIADALARGTPASEVLVLARTGYATQPAQAALARAGIPHRVLGSLGLYERAEVRDALSYLALLANPADAQAFRKAVQAPKRGVGVMTANRIVTHARDRHRGDLIAASAHARQVPGIHSDAARERLARFGESLHRVRLDLQAGRSLMHNVVSALTIGGGLVRQHQTLRDSSPSAEQRRDAERVLEDLRSLCRAAEAYEEHQGERATLIGFLEHAAGLHAQQITPGEPDRRITVSTIHRAKGTEAKLVILLACEEQLLPSWRALQAPDPDQLAEERRLFYVACTRAKDHLAITHAASRGNRNARQAARPASSPKPDSSPHPERSPPNQANRARTQTATRESQPTDPKGRPNAQPRHRSTDRPQRGDRRRHRRRSRSRRRDTLQRLHATGPPRTPKRGAAPSRSRAARRELPRVPGALQAAARRE